MQYIEYEYAREHKIVGDLLYQWLKTVKHLGIRTKGHTIKDWREGKVLLNVGDIGPGSSSPKMIEEWTKNQADKDYHRKAYQSAYLKGYFKI